MIDHIFFFFIYFTSFGEKDKADINSLRWSALVGLKPAYTHMWVARSTTVLWTPTKLMSGMSYNNKIYWKELHTFKQLSVREVQNLTKNIGDGW